MRTFPTRTCAVCERGARLFASVLLFLVVASLSVGASSLAQTVDRARVHGSVVDDEGSPVPKFELRFVAAEGTSHPPMEKKTNKKGQFSMPFFPMGRFRVELVDDSEYFIKQMSVRATEAGIGKGEMVVGGHPEKGVPPFAVMRGWDCEIDLVLGTAVQRSRLKQQMANVEARGPLTRMVELFDTGDMDGVLAESKKVLAERPDLGSAHYLRGMALWRTDRLEEAEEALEKALVLVPEQEGLRGAIGSVMLEKANRDEVEDPAVFEKAARLINEELGRAGEKPVPLLINYALALESAGRNERGARALEDLIEADPGNLTAYFRLAEIHRKSGEHQAAVDVLGRIPGAGRESADSIYNIAVELYNENAYDAVLPALGKAVELSPDHSQAHRLLGLTHVALGQADLAIERLETALELDPDHPNAADDRALIEALSR